MTDTAATAATAPATIPVREAFRRTPAPVVSGPDGIVPAGPGAGKAGRIAVVPPCRTPSGLVVAAAAPA